VPEDIVFARDFVGVEEACVVDVPFPVPDVAVELCADFVAVPLVAVEFVVGGAVAWIT